MVTTIAHRELRNNSSEILRRVTQGEVFLVTNSGAVVAEIRQPAPVALGSHRYRPATIVGRFDEVELVDSPLTSQQIMDELKGDR